MEEVYKRLFAENEDNRMKSIMIKKGDQKDKEKKAKNGCCKSQ